MRRLAEIFARTFVKSLIAVAFVLVGVVVVSVVLSLPRPWNDVLSIGLLCAVFSAGYVVVSEL